MDRNIRFHWVSLWRLPTTPTDTPTAALLRHRANPTRYINHWDTMLRVAATIRHGHLPASLLVSRLQASARQNQLTRAIQEYGRIIKTTSILRYLHDKGHRRRIHAQLNKGETLHALRRQLFFANQGQIRRRRAHDQDIQGEALTLLTNAIIEPPRVFRRLYWLGDNGVMGRLMMYSPEVRERAVRLVLEHRGEHRSEWAAICSIAEKFGCSSETLRKWVRRAETDQGLRPGLTSPERERLRALEREVRELRRANEILRKASAYFAQAELDRRPRR